MTGGEISPGEGTLYHPDQMIHNLQTTCSILILDFNLYGYALLCYQMFVHLGC